MEHIDFTYTRMSNTITEDSILAYTRISNTMKNIYLGYTRIHNTLTKAIRDKPHAYIPKTQAEESVAKAMSMAWFTAWKRFVLRVSPNSVVVSGTNFGSACTGFAA